MEYTIIIFNQVINLNKIKSKISGSFKFKNLQKMAKNTMNKKFFFVSHRYYSIENFKPNTKVFKSGL